MGYMQEFEAELRKRLASGLTADDVVTWVKKKVLESYRNGLSEGKKPGKVAARKDEE